MQTESLRQTRGNFRIGDMMAASNPVKLLVMIATFLGIAAIGVLDRRPTALPRISCLLFERPLLSLNSTTAGSTFPLLSLISGLTDTVMFVALVALVALVAFVSVSKVRFARAYVTLEMYSSTPRPSSNTRVYSAVSSPSGSRQVCEHSSENCVTGFAMNRTLSDSASPRAHSR